jgi:methylenetetrahydrofolate reductase (NADPH)
MKVIEHIAKARGPLISYEIVPPPRGSSVKDIIDVVEVLAESNPPWIDVTSHSSVTQYHERGDGTISKRTVRKRPGTLGICGIIQNRFKIDTVAHILCQGFSKEETEDALIELSFLGIHNVLALRGDTPAGSGGLGKTNRFASDLVGQINEMRDGKFVEEIVDSAPLDFCVGVAGYPEKHFEAPSLRADVQHLKRKVDAGADYVITQMFFDNDKFFAFERECREAGITVPIIPGLKVLRSAAQLRTLPRSFFIDLPDALVESVLESPHHAAELGQAWTLKQSRDLLERGCKTLHYYVLNDVQAVKSIVSKLGI